MAYRRCTLIVSDVHLGAGPSASEDRLSRCLVAACARAGGDELEVVLNGDVFDFDVPQPWTPGHPAMTSAGARRTVAEIVAWHPVFVDTVRWLTRTDRRVVFVAGNHDAQLNFASVRDALRGELPGVEFRSWFHRTRDGILVEHGHLHDPLCAPEIVVPADHLDATLGSIASHRMPATLACVNPYAVNPFDVSARDVLASLATDDVPHRVATMARMILELDGVASIRYTQSLESLLTHETDSPPNVVARHVATRAPKLNLVQLAATQLWKNYGQTLEQSLRSAMRRLAAIHGARAVVTGHTHAAFGTTEDGVFYGNSGAWAPGHPGSYVWSECEGQGLSIGTHAWEGS